MAKFFDPVTGELFDNTVAADREALDVRSGRCVQLEQHAVDVVESGITTLGLEGIRQQVGGSAVWVEPEE